VNLYIDIHGKLFRYVQFEDEQSRRYIKGVKELAFLIKENKEHQLMLI